MSQDTCIPYTINYKPPCFIDEQSNLIGHCRPVDLTECGIDLRSITRNAKTERLFAVANRRGVPDILSYEDVFKMVLSERENQNIPRATLEKRARLFLDNARLRIEKNRQK